MMKYILFLSSFFIFNIYAQEIFQININASGITSKNISEKLISDKKGRFGESDLVSLLVINETQEKVYAALKSDLKVFMRFTIAPSEKKTIEFKNNYLKDLFFVPLAPSLPEVEISK